MTEVVIAAAVQATPVFLDREATIDKVVDLTAKAAAEGAGLVVFPEAFVPTYPDWVWRTPAWSDRLLYEALAAQAVTVPSAATDRMGEAALAARAWLAVGVNEKDRNGATLYNTLLYFAPTGPWLRFIANSWPPVASEPSGDRATARHSPCSTPPSAGWAG